MTLPTSRYISFAHVRLLAFMLLVLFSPQLVGCVIGYKTYSVEERNTSAQTRDFRNIKISYDIDTWSKKELHYSLTRILRERFHILDLKPKKEKEPGRFLIRLLGESHDEINVETIWMIVNILSFATIPALYDDRISIKFIVVSPNDESKTFQYDYTERIYSWLPIGLLNARYFCYMMGCIDEYEEERIKVFDAITTRFMIDAETFFLTHTSPTTQNSRERLLHD